MRAYRLSSLEQPNALHRNNTETTMYAKTMKAFDHFALTFFVVLAATPLLAVAAGGMIR